jgi:hypothetical protein
MKAIGLGVCLGTASLLVATGMAQSLKPALSLNAAAVYSEVRSGEVVYVHVTFTNTSKRVATISFSVPLCDYTVEVRDGAGNLAPDSEAKSKMKCDKENAGAHGIIELKPNESATSTVSVNMFSDLSRPGEYSVQVGWRAPKELGDVVVKSNTVKITVAP